jgi:carbon storage regulator
MLVLSRYIDESIVITIPPSDKPTTVTVTQVGIQGTKSRLGFEAPKTVTVHRSEVQDSIERLGKLGPRRS